MDASARPRSKAQTEGTCSKIDAPSLTRKLRDEIGDRLTPIHTKRRGRRLRYYVSNRLISSGTDPSGWRLSAPALEEAITNIITQHVSKRASIHQICVTPDIQTSEALNIKAATLAQRLKAETTDGLTNILTQGQLSKRQITFCK